MVIRSLFFVIFILSGIESLSSFVIRSGARPGGRNGRTIPLEASLVDNKGPDKLTESLGIPLEYWTWKRRDSSEHKICYQKSAPEGGGEGSPTVLLVHGFGGNSRHWRKNLPELGKQHRTYAIDLLGYGYSDKPNPRLQTVNAIYNFETWAEQLEAFSKEVMGVSPSGGGVYVVCNSVGGLAGLQLGKNRPDLVKGIMLLNISLRMLHEKKQSWFIKPFVKALQNTLRETDVGKRFFAQVATPKGVSNALKQAYHDDDQVNDELVDAILKPGLEPGAVDVFLDFISYSGGPLPEDLLPVMKVPVYIGWGERDPWEPLELGRAYGEYDCVREFRVLPNIGHCPQDEAPHVVNPFIREFVQKLEDEAKAKAAAA